MQVYVVILYVFTSTSIQFLGKQSNSKYCSYRNLLVHTIGQQSMINAVSITTAGCN